MPEFPRHQSKGQLTTQQPSVQATEDATGQILEKTAKLASQAQETALKLTLAMESTRNTVATVNHKSDILEIQQEALLDTDPNNEKSYIDRLNKSYQKHSQGLNTLDARELALNTQNASIQLQNIFRKKWLEVDALAVDRFIDQQVSNPTPGSFLEIKKLLAEKVSTGHMTETKSYEKEKEANEALGVGSINRDLYGSETPQEVGAVMRRITSGYYESGGVNIDPKKKEALLTISEKTKKTLEIENQKKIAIQQNQGEEAVASLIVSGANRAEAISTFESLFKRGDISEESYNSAKKSFEQSNADEFDSTTWTGLMLDYSKISQAPDPIQAVRNFRNEVLTKKHKLLEKYYKEFLQLSGAKQLEINASKMNGLQKFIEGFKKFFEKNEKEVKKDPALIKNFIDTVDKYLKDRYVPGQEVSKAGRKFKVVKQDDGSIGFEEIT